jgi:hypothetical protein
VIFWGGQKSESWIANEFYYLQLQYCVSFPDGENMMRPTSMSHNTDSSYAFLISPLRRLEYVTCLFVGFSIFLISNFTLPMAAAG